MRVGVVPVGGGMLKVGEPAPGGDGDDVAGEMYDGELATVTPAPLLFW